MRSGLDIKCLLHCLLLNCICYGLICSSGWFVSSSISSQLLFCTGGLIWLVLASAFCVREHIGLPTQVLCLASIMLIYIWLHPAICHSGDLRLRQWYLSASLVWCITFSVILYHDRKLIYAVFMLSAALSALAVLHCWMQHLLIIPSRNSNFSVTGMFANPNVTAMLLASSIPSWNYLIRELSWQRSAKAALCIILIILSGCAAFWLNCRTAWIGAFAAISFTAITNKKVRHIWNNTHTGNRLLYLTALFALLISFGAVLYHMKADSAKARWYIWQRTLLCIIQRPVSGFGFGQFERTFHLSRLYDSGQGNLTGYDAQATETVNSAYNDYLERLTEGGAIYAVLTLCLLWCIIKPYVRSSGAPERTRETMTALNTIITTGIMASVNFYSSVPMLQAVNMSMAAILLAPQCHRLQKPIHSWLQSVIWTSSLMLATLFLPPYLCAQAQLKKVADSRTDSVETDMAHLAGKLGRSDAYWCLRAQKSAACSQYDNASTCLLKALDYTAFPQVYHDLFLYAIKAGDIALAEQALLNEIGIIPGRLAPRYHLWQLYCSQGDNEKARQTALDILQLASAEDKREINHFYRDIMSKYLAEQTATTTPACHAHK